MRDVPDETARELESRAALTGRSLQEYLRARLIDLAASPDAEAWAASVCAGKRSTGESLDTATIVRYRDDERR
ncbi:MAG: FitA-like ribbon-helix-helix domain-containing protein [Actinomycetota bacterium]